MRPMDHIYYEANTLPKRSHDLEISTNNTLKHITLTLLLFIFFVTPGSTSDSALQLNLDVKEFRLNNGMLFLIIQRPTAPQVSARLRRSKKVGKPVLHICLNTCCLKAPKILGR
jgi:hypothetical protein